MNASTDPPASKPAGRNGSIFTSFSSTGSPASRARMTSLRATSRPDRSSRGSGSVKPRSRASATTVAELAAITDVPGDEAAAAGEDALEADQPVAALEQVLQRVDERQPGAHGRLVEETCAPRVGGVAQFAVVIESGSVGPLVRGDHVNAGLEKRRVPRGYLIAGGRIHQDGVDDVGRADALPQVRQRQGPGRRVEPRPASRPPGRGRSCPATCRPAGPGRRRARPPSAPAIGAAGRGSAPPALRPPARRPG